MLPRHFQRASPRLVNAGKLLKIILQKYPPRNYKSLIWITITYLILVVWAVRRVCTDEHEAERVDSREQAAALDEEGGGAHVYPDGADLLGK